MRHVVVVPMGTTVITVLYVCLLIDKDVVDCKNIYNNLAVSLGVRGILSSQSDRMSEQWNVDEVYQSQTEHFLIRVVQTILIDVTPKTKRVSPLINTARLKRIHGSSSCLLGGCFIM